MIGQTLWKYKITEFLGSGGSAKVWKANDERNQREVAIKILPPQIDGDVLVRFKQETKAISSLDHPNIIKIHDIGTDGTLHYYVMDYVKGRTLKELIHEHWDIQRTEPSEKLIATVGADVAAALEYTHSKRIYHRDITPGNIFVKDTGSSVLMDFGIAKLTDERTLTAVGTLIGTPLYMSPEQLQGHEVDHTSDVYQLGIVLYKMASGKVPFEGENAYTAAVRRLTDKIPPPSRYHAGISPRLERIILKATMREPRDRYPNAGAMKDDLIAVRDNSSDGQETSVVAPPPTVGSADQKSGVVAVRSKGVASPGPAPVPAAGEKKWTLRASIVANIALAGGLIWAMFPGSTAVRLEVTPPRVETTVSTATVTFRTVQPLRTEIAYGPGELTHLAPVSNQPAQDHRVTLKGLQPGRKYTFCLRLLLESGKLVRLKMERFQTRSDTELVDGPAADAATLDRARDGFASGDYAVRLATVKALPRPTPRALTGDLAALLTDPNNEVREASYKALGPLMK